MASGGGENVIQFIPFIDWLAALTSLTLLIVLWKEGDTGQVAAVVLGVWFVAAAGVQVFSDSFLATRIALALQTVLAVADRTRRICDHPSENQRLTAYPQQRITS